MKKQSDFFKRIDSSEWTSKYKDEAKKYDRKPEAPDDVSLTTERLQKIAKVPKKG